MVHEVVLNKKESIERCIRQVREYYGRDNGLPFEQDFQKQDAIGLNLQRIAEFAIDIANHVVSSRRLGIPKTSREAFELLKQAGVIDEATARQMTGMVGFRNILVHDYRKMDLKIFRGVVEHHLDDVISYTNQVLSFIGDR